VSNFLLTAADELKEQLAQSHPGGSWIEESVIPVLVLIMLWYSLLLIVMFVDEESVIPLLVLIMYFFSQIFSPGGSWSEESVIPLLALHYVCKVTACDW
jgi:hypothetical protein